MTGSSPRVNLVSLASVRYFDEMHDALAELGYRIRPKRCEEWPQDPRYRCQAPVVFLLGRRPAICSESLNRLFNSAVNVPVVGVYERDMPLGLPAVLGQCTDFLGWPCHHEELALRLERAGFTASGGGTRVDDEDVLAAFAQTDMIGRSPEFITMLTQLGRTAVSDAPVLLRGETGTGKELAARAIHYRGDRRRHPFIPVNCGAIPDNLVENELFGHERGAFTDAGSVQRGLVAEADGGTLFLDEVDSLSPKAQVALLRFLQDREYKPLGASNARTSDVRIIAATNGNLEARVERKEFRQDLMYRLKILLVTLPPLRERVRDIPLLVEHFLARYLRRYGGARKVVDPRVLEWMQCQLWPGNVRELESVVHRGFLAAHGSTIELTHVLEGTESAVSDPTVATFDVRSDFNRAKADTIDRFERRYLTWLMSETGGNVTRAARRAGKERRAFGKLLKKHGIQKSLFSAE